MDVTTFHTPRFLNELLRRQLASFVEMSFRDLNPTKLFVANWHIEAMCHALEQVEKGKIKRLIITLPPRTLKSFTVSAAFAAWVLGHDPAKKIISVSYSRDLAVSLGTGLRNIMQSDRYRALFPNARLGGKNTETEQSTTAGGMRYATSVGGTLTGRGGDLILVDDPIKAGDVMSEAERTTVNAWFRDTLLSRLDSKRDGAIVIVMQRLHEDDLVGHLTEAEDHGWTVLDIPAIAPEDRSYRVSNQRSRKYYHRKAGEVIDPTRESRENLEQLRRDLGSAQFAAQYQQNPLPPQGNLIKREWLASYSQMPALSTADAIVQSWDTAMNAKEQNDYSVCTTWAIFGRHYYLLDVFRQRVEFPQLKRAALDLIQRYRPSIVLIEQAGHGIALRQELLVASRARRERPSFPSPSPKGDKESRVSGVSSMIEDGRVLIPAEALWRDAFIKEIAGFPSTRNDDQVDSVTQFLSFVRMRRSFPQCDPETGRRKLQRTRLRPRDSIHGGKPDG